MGKENGSRDLTAALPLQIPEVWEPRSLSAGRETQRWGWDTVPGRGKAELTTHSRNCRQHCLCNPGLSQAALPRHGDQIGRNHGFPHIKGENKKCFPFHRQEISATRHSYDFSYREAVQPDPAQPRSKLIPQTWPRGAVLLGMFPAHSGT